MFVTTGAAKVSEKALASRWVQQSCLLVFFLKNKKIDAYSLTFRVKKRQEDEDEERERKMLLWPGLGLRTNIPKRRTLEGSTR